MVLISVDFPPTLQNDYTKQDIYLKHLKKEAQRVLFMYQYGNTRDFQDLKIRLSLIEKYLKERFKIRYSLMELLLFAFNNIKYNISRTKIEFDKEAMIGNIRLIEVLKIIQYGTLTVKGCDIITRCLKSAFNIVFVNIVWARWGLV